MGASRMIPIQRDLVTDLDVAQGQLDAYVTAFIRIQEQAQSCVAILHLLAWIKREPSRLEDPFFREQLSDELSKLQSLEQALKVVLASATARNPDVILRVKQHDAKLLAAMDAIGIVENPTQDADLNAATDTIYRSIRDIRGDVHAISNECKDQAGGSLAAIRKIVTTIFAVDTSRQLEERGPQPEIRSKPLADGAPDSVRFTSPNERTQTPVAVTGTSTSTTRSESSRPWEGGI
jgi:hypothetical protein